MIEKFHGLLYGPNLQHLDHIASLCSLLDIPLFVTEKDIEKIATDYYPNLLVYYFDYEDFPHYFYKETNAFVSCLPKDMLNEIFFLPSQFIEKKMISVWCPHGNSEKGFNSYFSESLSKETILLCYGPKVLREMELILKQTNPTIVPVGNYRLSYYQKLDRYFDEKIQKFLGRKVDPQKKTVLFAPSWKEKEIFDEVEKRVFKVVGDLCESFNVLVKLHPNTIHKFSIEVGILESQIEEKAVFVHEIPTIYPLLNITDLYIGNHTSIVYDFLYFKRPILLFESSKPFAQSISLSSEESIFSIVEKSIEKDPIEPSMYEKEYEKAFYENISDYEIKNGIIQAIEHEQSNE